MVEPVRVQTLFPAPQQYAPAGHYRPSDGRTGHPHPADGMTAQVSFGDGAVGTIINPQSFANGGPEWVMRYGNPEGIRYTVASLLESFDYLLSSGITAKEAIERLRIMRAVRADLVARPSKDEVEP